MDAQWKRAVTPAVVGSAALATVAAVTFTTAVPQVLSREKVELTATITPGSATNWNADGIDKFYGVDWNSNYGDTVIAPFRLVQFWQGAQNILTALDAAQGDGEPDVVVSSGRGAGNASAAITWLAHTDPDGARLNDTLWILDNNVDRPNGGYAARYPFFALVGVNPVPVPNDLEGVQILDVGYQYAWNSSAPTYISNLPALLNAIIAYAYRYQQQDKLPIPAEILDPETGQLKDDASGYYIVRTDGTVDRYDFAPGSKVTTVYVTYETNGLPMLQPIRDFGGDLGNAFADVVEPALTVLVNASYTNNDPLADPSVYTPMQLFAPLQVWAKAAEQLPGALAEGWQKLQEHLGGTAEAEEPDARITATTSEPQADKVGTDVAPDASEDEDERTPTIRSGWQKLRENLGGTADTDDSDPGTSDDADQRTPTIRSGWQKLRENLGGTADTDDSDPGTSDDADQRTPTIRSHWQSGIERASKKADRAATAENPPSGDAAGDE